MDGYALLLYMHLLLFVYWLGADVGVFALALALKRRTYSCEQRVLLMRMSLTIDMVPRMAMIAVSPIGLHLADQAGLIEIPGALFVLIWGLAISWMVGEWVAFRRMGRPDAVRIYIVNGIFMTIFCFSLIGLGISSVVSGWPIVFPWLALKALLAGLVFLVSIMMAVFYAPLEGIFARMATEGSTDAIEAEVRSQVNKGALFTVILFLLLATIAFLGLAKPF